MVRAVRLLCVPALALWLVPASPATAMCGGNFLATCKPRPVAAAKGIAAKPKPAAKRRDVTARPPELRR